MSTTLTGALGLIAGRMKTRAETEDDKPDPAAETEDDPKAADETPEDEAEGDDPDPEAEGEEDDAAAEGEDDEKPAMRAAYRRGFAAANARAQAILTCEASAAVPALAADLAFNRTGLTADEAVGIMQAATGDKAAARAGAGTLAEKMSAHRTGVKPLGAPKAKGADGMADRIHAASLAAIDKRKGKRS